MPLRRKIYYVLLFSLLSIICGFGALFSIGFVEFLEQDDNKGASVSIIWSPNGQYIALLQYIRWSSEALFVAGVDTLEPTLVADNYPSSPVWSPDSRRLIFTSRTNTTDNNEDLYVVNIDGSGLINLTNSSASELEPVWSPDGQHIAFTSHHDGRRRLYVMRENGTEVRQLFSYNTNYPAWSPDGESIVFRGSNPDEDTGHLYRVDVEAGNLTRLTDEPGTYADPTWSPDGRSIAFVIRLEGEVGLYVMDANGAHHRRLLSSGSLYTHSWSPDGRWIAFYDPEGLHVIDAENALVLEFDSRLNRNLFWYPSGEQLLSLVVNGVRVDSPKTIETYNLGPAS